MERMIVITSEVPRETNRSRSIDEYCHDNVEMDILQQRRQSKTLKIIPSIHTPNISVENWL